MSANVTRRKTRHAPPAGTILEQLKFEDGKVCALISGDDAPQFGITNGSKLFLYHDEDPKPFQLVVLSIEECRDPIIGRFHEWQWDEVLVTTADGELRILRPITLAPIDWIESPNEKEGTQ